MKYMSKDMNVLSALWNPNSYLHTLATIQYLVLIVSRGFQLIVSQLVLCVANLLSPYVDSTNQKVSIN